MDAIRKYEKYGVPFQLLLVASFLFRTYAFAFPATKNLSVGVVGIFGLAVASYCLLTLYRKDGRAKLITNGIFQYTRHPMYTGFMLMDMGFWLTQVRNIKF